MSPALPGRDCVMLSRMNSAAVLFGFLCSLNGILTASDDSVTDSTTGKAPSLAIAAVPGVFVSGFEAPLQIPDSSIGKSPSPVVFDGPPPHGAGPGLQFNTSKLFYIYTDHRASANHFVPSGWMGDYGDIRVDDASKDDPADGKTCIRFTYTADGSQGFGWAGVYWQQPENNWGNKRGGFDLTGMKRLTFWARGAAGGEEIGEF